MIALALLLALADAAPAPKNEIVVRGTSLKALEADLNRCIAAHCPTREDVIASVRYAEGLFRSARYQDSRRVLQSAIDRDKAAAKADPSAVSALYEATATVARHDGEQAVVASATYGRARLLHQALPADSAEVLRADMDVADLAYSREGPLRALPLYRVLETRARAANQPAIVAGAILREAQAELVDHDVSGATRKLDDLIRQGDTLPVGYRLAAFAMKTRLPHRRNDTSAVDALRDALAKAPQPRPVLLSAPLPPKPHDPAGLDYYNNVDNVTQSGDITSISWADIGFTIRPDGTVDMPLQLRGNLAEGNAKEIVAAMARRIYAPFPAATGDQYRIERWTLTADYATPIGSQIRRRIVNPHYESLDITTGPAPAKPAGAAS